MAECPQRNYFVPSSSLEKASYIKNLQLENNHSSNNYNHDQRNDPYFSWANNQGAAPRLASHTQLEKKPFLEKMFLTLMQKTVQYMQMTDLTLQSHLASIKKLENQIKQLATILQEQTTGTLPSNTVQNLQEQVNSISLRSEREVELPKRGEVKSIHEEITIRGLIKGREEVACQAKEESQSQEIKGF